MADDVTDAAASAKSKFGRAVGWTFNQFHPFGEKGKLIRTVSIGVGLMYGGGVLEGLKEGSDFLTAAVSPVGDFIAGAWSGGGEIADGVLTPVRGRAGRASRTGVLVVPTVGGVALAIPDLVRAYRGLHVAAPVVAVRLLPGVAGFISAAALRPQACGEQHHGRGKATRLNRSHLGSSPCHFAS